MIEFKVVKHEFYPTSAPDSRYAAALKSQHGNYLFLDGGQSILAEFPVGAKFVLLPAESQVEMLSKSGPEPLRKNEIPTIKDLLDWKQRTAKGQPETLIESSLRIADEARNRNA